jgi:spore maturation protein CgeB
MVLKLWKPDLLFVESAWQGMGNSWKFKIATYPDRPERTNATLRKVITYARDLDIPCVFWNKEDRVHFERFISSASLFDTIFTVDSGCVKKYHQRIDHKVKVAPLMFAAQSKIHYFTGFGERLNRSNFVGSYSHHLHDLRRERQDMLLSSASSTVGLTVYDRNSNRKSINYRYPDYSGIVVKKRVPHHKTADIYKTFLVSLNFNTVDNSETMVSRRLIEIMACGGLAVTTPALSVDTYFQDYCHVVDSSIEAVELFNRLKSGYSSKDLEMMRDGADYIARHHTYSQMLQTILDKI